MKKNKFLPGVTLFVCVLFGSSFCFAQVTRAWVATYNSTGTDVANALAVDVSGNVYVTGSGYRAGAPGFDGTDYVTIKYNSSGVQQWLVRYNGPADRFDKATAIAVDISGNVYVTGWSYGTTGTGNYDYTTIKYNSNGVEQWMARYSGVTKLDDNAEAIAVDASGNVYVTGWSGWTSSSAASTDYATIKYNSSGVQQWVARYNGPAGTADIASSLLLDNSGNVYVTGKSNGIATGYDYATIKYNSAGTLLWVSRYNGPPGNANDDAEDIALDASGNVYVTGQSTGTGTDFDYATVKYNAAGVQQWVSRYNGPGNGVDDAHSIAVDGSGNVYVTGESNALAAPGINFDWATIKYNAAGVQQWLRRYVGPTSGNDRARALALDGSGNIYVTGHHQAAGSNWNNYLTLKYDAAGTFKWLADYNSPAPSSSDIAKCIIVDGSGNVYITGEGNNDYVAIKYSQSAARKATAAANINLPSKFLVFNYPNPATSTTRIRYELPFDGNLSIDIYDMPGRIITSLADQFLNAGYYNNDLDVSTLQKGVYYYKALLQSADKKFTRSGKIIVVK